MATLYKAADNSSTEVHPKNGEEFSLEELQEYVGGWIELVLLDRETNKCMWIDEEGKLKNKPMNERATLLVRGKGLIADNDFIVGDALVTKGKETS